MVCHNYIKGKEVTLYAPIGALARLKFGLRSCVRKRLLNKREREREREQEGDRAAAIDLFVY